MKLHPLTLALAGLASISLSLPAAATTTVSAGYEFTTGKYGSDTRTTEHIIPFGLKHENGPWTFKFSVPYISAEGKEGRDSGVRAGQEVRQSGLGDVTASGFYNIFNDPATRFGVDVGLKAKFATADKDKFLLTTGENDYSVQADFYGDFKPVANTTWFGTIGWTKKGDPENIDYENPMYFSAGFSYKLSDADSWGAAYDYREETLPFRDPISEASVFFTHRYSKVLKVQGYALREFFSDNSPDLGVGFNVFYSF